MDDLKIVFYILVGIIWVVYNNYKKITEASGKRDFTKPFSETIPENWPALPEKKKPVAKQVTETQKPKEKREVLRRNILPKRTLPGKPARVEISQQIFTSPQIQEGGLSTPSKVVQFEESTLFPESPNGLLTALRNMDLRQAIVMSEVLNRPYN